MCRNCIERLRDERKDFGKADNDGLTENLIGGFLYSLVLDAANQTELTLENIEEITKDQEPHFQRLADLLSPKMVGVEISREDIVEYARKEYLRKLKRAVEKETYAKLDTQVSDFLDFNPLLFAENVEESTAFVKTLLNKVTPFNGRETPAEVVEEIYPAILLHVIESIRELDLVKVHEYIERINSNTKVEEPVPCYFNYELRSPHAFATARTRASALFALACGMIASGVSKEEAKEALAYVENTIQQRLVTITQSLNDDDIQDIKDGKLFGEVR